MNPENIHKGFVLLKCTACGSTWFREEEFYELLPTWGVLPHSREKEDETRIDVMVCVCGQPEPPMAKGTDGPMRRARARRLQSSLERMNDRSKAQLMAAFKEQAAVKRAQLPALQKRVQKLARAVGRILAKEQLDAGKRMARGRHWQPPRRQSANQSNNKGQDSLALQLQKRFHISQSQGRSRGPFRRDSNGSATR